MATKGDTHQGRRGDEYTYLTWREALAFWATASAPLGALLLIWYICC